MSLPAWLAGLLPGGIHGFAAPAWLLLLPVVLVALPLAAHWRRPPALPWPALPEGLAAGARRHDPLGWLAGGLRLAALAALVLALAEPLGAAREVRLRHDGLDLLLVVDASGSMRALDARVRGDPRTRLDLAREVVSRFASHRVASGDRVGLVVFGASAFTQCPLTRDGALLSAALAQVEAGVAGEATALGDALALAVKRVLAGEPDAPAGGADAPAAGRLIVLLTDGRANAGSVPVDVAAGLAAHHGIRVHTVGIGGTGEVAMASPRGGRSLRRERHDLDMTGLERIAAATGGRAFHARRSDDLEAVYAEIDRLERVPREAPPQVAGVSRAEPLLAAAGLLVALELLLARVLARRLP